MAGESRLFSIVTLPSPCCTSSPASSRRRFVSRAVPALPSSSSTSGPTTRRMAPAAKGKWVQPSTRASGPAASTGASRAARQRSSAGPVSSPRSTNFTSSGQGHFKIWQFSAQRCSRAANFSSRSVASVASTPMQPPGWRETASLSAGSMPMMTRSGQRARSSPMAADVAVLQATTRAFAPRSNRRSAWASVRERISAVGRVP